MEKNPDNLKIHDDKPSDYLNADEFISFCLKKKILIKRKDNLPRFCRSNGIKMIKIKREGSGGSVPIVYKIPSETKIKEIVEKLRVNNNSLLGREVLKKKKEKILDIFDKAEPGKETKTSIAFKVSQILGVSCNRKLVKSILDQKRSTKINKLQK